MEVDRPIIIFGTGRCGTTIFHRLFSMHPEVTWLSDLCERHPNRPELNRRLMKALEYPILNNHPPVNVMDFGSTTVAGSGTPAKILWRLISPLKASIIFARQCPA